MKKGDMVITAGVWGTIEEEGKAPVLFVTTPALIKSWGKKKGTVLIGDKMSKNQIWNPQENEGKSLFGPEQKEDAIEYARRRCESGLRFSLGQAKKFGKVGLGKWLERCIKEKAWETAEIITTDSILAWIN